MLLPRLVYNKYLLKIRAVILFIVCPSHLLIDVTDGEKSQMKLNTAEIKHLKQVWSLAKNFWISLLEEGFQ